MESNLIRLVGLRGSTVHDVEAYRRAKTPFGQWANVSLTENQAREWLAQGGWLGWRVPSGVVVVDIDDLQMGDLARTLFAETMIIQTPRGIQLLFADTGKIDSQRADCLTRCGLTVDYRLPGRGYIVYPHQDMVQWSGGRERKLLKRQKPLPPLPDLLLPVGAAHDNKIVVPIKEGARNDQLFRHACRLRAINLPESEIRSVIEWMNAHLSIPSLPERELGQLLKSALSYPPSGHHQIDIIPLEPVPVDLPIISARILLESDLPPVEWIVPGLLPQGLALLVGKSKIGKSWLVMQMALAAVNGQRFLNWQCREPIRALYLSLEDNQRRLQKRLKHCNQPVEGLDVAITWKQLQMGGREMLENYLSSNPACRLVIVDTLQKIRGLDNGKINAYQADYAVMGALKSLADAYNCSIVAIHHTRKGEADDWVDMVSGTTGLVGAADSLLYLDRKRGDANATLYATGRDFEVEVEEALRFESGLWSSIGRGEEVRLSLLSQAILEQLQAHGTVALHVLAQLLNKPASSLSRALSNLVELGEIEKTKRGHYQLVAKSMRYDLELDK